MIGIEGRLIGEVFAEAAARWPERDFLVAPSRDGGTMRALSYGEVAARVEALAAALVGAGYGPGHRAAVLLGTCPEHYIAKLAMARAGVSFVPVNPDYRPGELAYLLEDSGAVLAVADFGHEALMHSAMAELEKPPHFSKLDALLEELPPPPFAAVEAPLGPESECALLYTSGTTGRPKGCIFSHEYALMQGVTYARIGPPVALGENDRVFNPLPAFHVNAGVINFYGVMLCGAALIQPERFSAARWWEEVRETGATVFHYLGVIIAVLLADKTAGPERLAALRLGVGAGVEPSLHVAFERRFGIPLVEVWGMTEMCRVMSMEAEPRMIDTRAMGRARDDLEVQVWDDAGTPCPPGTPGEMVIRHSEETPRKGFFSGYLGQPEATEEAWRGGWFHTGDTVRMSPDGVIHFVDRKKNIIRRAGENIAAAEVENVLMEDERVLNVACVAVPDALREEEVLAAIVLDEGVPDSRETAMSIFSQAYEKMAYYKVPGWVLFVDELPVTGTQKVVKHKLFAPDEDPRDRPGIHDLRAAKKKG